MNKTAMNKELARIDKAAAPLLKIALWISVVGLVACAFILH